jgi:hypothetical protein
MSHRDNIMHMEKTLLQYEKIRSVCRLVFEEKMKDYGTAWRVLRLPSLTDQIFIKAQRIRSIQEKGAMAVKEGVEQEFVGIVNYAIMALTQLELKPSATGEPISRQHAMELYDRFFQQALLLMQAKNTDYSEAWRDMRISSLTDIILMKLLRVKQIEDNHGETRVSEGIDASYYDIINYAAFALIKLAESESHQQKGQSEKTKFINS